VRKEFDLGKDVKGKNAYLVAHLLEEAYKQKGPSKALESVVAAIKAFAQAAHTATATSLDTSRAPVRPDQAAQAARIQEFDNAPVPAKR
jgi:hypothetical protein